MRKKVALNRISELEKELAQVTNKLNTMNVQYEKMLNDYKVCYSALEASQKRIKELSEENSALTAEAETLRSNNAKLCTQNEEYRAVAAVSQPAAEEPDEETPSIAEEKEANVAATYTTPAKTTVTLSEIEKYGSGVIGSVVVEATCIIGDLAGKTTPNAKDTLTLVLGRTEVLKSEVLAIVQDTEMTDDEKKQRIAQCRDQAMEYLASVKAQD